MARDYNREIAETLRKDFNEENLHFRFDSDNGLFRFAVKVYGNIESVNYVIKINKSDYTVYAISPVSPRVDRPEQLQHMAEFICRANYGLKNGNFEMDFTDGELRYKCYMNCDGALPTKDMVNSSIHTPAAMFSHYSEGILQVLFAGMSAIDAIKLCEGTPEVTVYDSDGEE